MAHNHNHDHNHDHEHEVITLVDEQGNETLFEILLTIDGREEFGKNYVLLVPAGAEEDEQGQIEIQAYSFTENEDGTDKEYGDAPDARAARREPRWRVRGAFGLAALSALRGHPLRVALRAGVEPLRHCGGTHGATVGRDGCAQDLRSTSQYAFTSGGVGESGDDNPRRHHRTCTRLAGHLWFPP